MTGQLRLPTFFMYSLVLFVFQLYPGVGHDIPKSHIYKHFYQTVTNYLAECFHIDDLSLAESESKK